MTACSDDGGIPEGPKPEPEPEPVQKTIPKVKTIDVTEVGQKSANGGGSILNNGNASILSKGVCWGLESLPTINDNISSDGSGDGNFVSKIDNLSPNTTYYVRAYATNSEGTSYGGEVTFRTGQITTGKSMIILKTTDGGENWISVTVENMTQLHSSFFVDDQTGYVSGVLGTINKTMDGGETWELQLSIGTIFESIFFIDKDTGYAVGNNGTIVHTKDGGINWEEQEWGFNGELNSVYFNDLNNGIIVGASGYILKTTNGGVKWETIYTTFRNNSMNAVIMTNENVGFAGNLSGMIMTTDGGLNWTRNYPTPHSVYDFHIVDKNIIYAVGGQGQVLKTDDGGETWETMTEVPTSLLRSVYFVDANIGYVSGDHGYIFKTTDGGETWNKQESGVVRDIYSIEFIDENTGFAFGVLD